MRKLFVYILLLLSISAFAQKERSMARKGNRFYADSAYTESEIAYIKALDENPDLREAQFNLANAAIRQEKFDEAIEQLDALANTSEDKTEKAEIYHNIGNSYLSKYQMSLQDQEKAKSAGEELDKSIASFKQALRNNPSDDETRYNLAVAQKLKEEGPPQQEQQEQDQEQQDQDKQDQEDQEKEQQEQEQDQQEQEQEQQEQQQPDEISKEDAEKILNAMMQDEKELQEEQKEKQKANARSRQVEKDW